MFKFMIVIFLFLSAESYGITRDECLDLTFSRKSNEKECFDILKNKAFLKNIKVTKTIKVVGQENAILLKKNNSKKQIITGSQTGLVNILDLDLSLDEERIMVLNLNANNNYEILIFPTHLSGNIKPYRVIRHLVITQSDAISFSPNRDEMFLVSNELKMVNVFSAKTNSRSPREKDRPVVLRTFTWEGMKNIVDISLGDNELLLLDDERLEFFGFNLDAKGEITPSWSVNDPRFEISAPVAIEFNRKDAEVVIKNANHEKIVFH